MHMSTLISFSGVAFAGLATAANITGVSAPSDTGLKGGFISYCWWTGEFIPRGEMYGKYIAQCPPSDANPLGGKDWHTYLDLNACLINHNGHMLWQANGGAFSTCFDCASEKGRTNMITCWCSPGGDDPKNIENKIDLNDGVYVFENRLACFDVVGTLG